MLMVFPYLCLLVSAAKTTSNPLSLQDHTGDPSLFPKSAELIVGPGFSDAFLPGYPSKKDSPMLETDFAYSQDYVPYIL